VGSGRFLRAGVAIAATAALLLPASAQAASIEPFETRTANGLALRGHVHLPDGPGPFATVLNFSPYWNGPAYLGSDQPGSPDTPSMRFLLDAGFAVALVNMRGTGLSQGCTTFGGESEWGDSAAVIEALADKPWSNGRIGMYGISFDGWSQWMAVAEAPPALKAVVPMSGVIDLWSLLTRRGAPVHAGPVTPHEWWALTSLTSIPPDLSHFNCVAEQVGNAQTALDLIRTGDHTPYFDARDMRPHVQGSDVPALVSNGLVYFDEGHVLQYEGLWDLLRPELTHFVLGQWGHDMPTEHKPDWNEQVLGWFDHYLRDGPKTTETGVVEYQDASGSWHTADRWPPPARPTALHLAGSSLSTQPPLVPSSKLFPSVPALDAAWWCGPQQALYVSPPLAEEVVVAGNIRFDLNVASILPGGNLVSVLRHTPGDGSCDEFANQAKDVGRAQLDLRHWSTPGASRNFPVNKATRVAVPGQPSAVRIPAGHRLVLGVSGGALELQPDPLLPLITIGGGSLQIPVVEGTLGF
jgi:X-Pro dipeptidyl-peptidase